MDNLAKPMPHFGKFSGKHPVLSVFFSKIESYSTGVTNRFFRKSNLTESDLIISINRINGRLIELKKDASINI